MVDIQKIKRMNIRNESADYLLFIQPGKEKKDYFKFKKIFMLIINIFLKRISFKRKKKRKRKNNPKKRKRKKNNFRKHLKKLK